MPFKTLKELDSTEGTVQLVNRKTAPLPTLLPFHALSDLPDNVINRYPNSVPSRGHGYRAHPATFIPPQRPPPLATMEETHGLCLGLPVHILQQLQRHRAI